MDQSDPRELQRQIELATRIASSVTDQTTVKRLGRVDIYLSQSRAAAIVTTAK